MRLNAIKTLGLLFFLLSVFYITPVFVHAGEFGKVNDSFDNFIKCELKTSLMDKYFGGEPYEIEYIRLYTVNVEGDITVLTGAVKCTISEKNSVSEKKIVLYLAAGLIELLGNKEISYFYSSKVDFRILATGVMKFPYKGDCKWQEFAMKF